MVYVVSVKSIRKRFSVVMMVKRGVRERRKRENDRRQATFSVAMDSDDSNVPAVCMEDARDTAI